MCQCFRRWLPDLSRCKASVTRPPALLPLLCNSHCSPAAPEGVRWRYLRVDGPSGVRTPHDTPSETPGRVRWGVRDGTTR